MRISRRIAMSEEEYAALVRRRHTPVRPAEGRNLVSSASPAADLLAWQLLQEGIPFLREFPFDPDRQWRADFLLPGTLLVEVEGGIWIKGRHNRGLGYEEDCMKYAAALLLGYKLLRVTPAQVQSEWACTQILNFLNKEMT